MGQLCLRYIHKIHKWDDGLEMDDGYKKNSKAFAPEIIIILKATFASCANILSYCSLCFIYH